MFRYWYVLPPDRGAPSRKLADLESVTKDGFYRVSAGDTEGEFKGWIHEDDVVEWHHRQALRFAKRTSRDLAHFFPEQEQSERAASTGDVEGASHREPEATEGDLILMPLLDSREIKAADVEMNLFEVAFLSGRPGAGATDPTGEGGIDVPGIDHRLTPNEVRELSTVDIVFVLDTTGSMGPPIAQVRRSISDVVNGLASKQDLREKLRFGLVGYRDSGDAYVSKIFCTLEEGKDHDHLLSVLGGIDVGGGGDYPEDVLAGVDRATAAEMKWNPLAWKNIVIVGDSSLKGPSHPMSGFKKNESSRSIPGMKAKLQPSRDTQALLESGFVVSAVRLKDPEYSADHPIGDRQFTELTTGREYMGLMIPVRGGSSPEDFSGQLTEFILTGMDNFDVAVRKGGGRKAAEPGTKESYFPYPVLDIIGTLSDDGDGGDGMRFGSRYCTEFDYEGNRLFVPHVFVRMGQLKSFNSMLEFLQGALEDAGAPGHRDVGNILKSLQIITTSLNLSEPITADMPLEKFLLVLLGFPLKTPIFHVTIGDLAAMSQVDYDDWVNGVRSTTETLDSLTENPNIWHKLHPTARDREAHAFVALADLP
ncbi:MAG: VWA domain-containing protein [Candidatus Eisenbacteria bacterium]